ncbi:MAG: hypothetical protein ABSG94_01160 [Brevinematales bacterium]|jgi:hypothetical protein
MFFLKSLLIFCLTAGLFSQGYSLKKDFSFLGLKLGMSESDVTNVLYQGSLLKIDESRFFGKINDAVPFIIKADYYPFIDGLFVQFYNNSAYGITIQFDPGYFDYQSISDKLQEKYGPPALLTSKVAIWDDSLSNTGITNTGIKLRLEYPSTVKVLNYDVMSRVNSDLKESMIRITNESIIQSNRKALLDDL